MFVLSMDIAALDIKYFSQDKRRNQPQIKLTVLKEADVERMMKDSSFDLGDFHRPYLSASREVSAAQKNPNSLDEDDIFLLKNFSCFIPSLLPHFQANFRYYSVSMIMYVSLFVVEECNMGIACLYSAVDPLRKRLGSGQVEELIEEPEDDLKLIRNMNCWSPAGDSGFVGRVPTRRKPN
ncbi:Probable NADH dehydrogenase [Striga hermonthica]|uniref:Probable NADH dehydrogenase n=1 Tax=Striga hermonthica TaxID=68872 RepID=A0A9N7N796_STRHE|nr:Probable NADH dehydrogenase [Striga hermonthica]